jgi:chromosome segregation protein
VRLNSIKLSAFKSFAEPTTFSLPGRLVGVVGPNGCGKSNIIDAVRWVLGESKASELRGESMQDVIFNGTVARKPASRASVELVFDNSDQRAGGQWSRFNEIAVKRVLTRDGVSSYHINNQVVRRRDVHDVFLGTGLGPRAYAIIGQGTIGRIIESRPEELRLFLEEAAGVSKYKERRRETESRLVDTRENLNRVDDVLRELGSNLAKLEKQADVARRYRDLQARATLKQNQLWFLKRRAAEGEQARVQSEMAQSATQLEARTAALQRAVQSVAGERSALAAASEALQQAQGTLYEATAEVARLEAEIRLVGASRARITGRVAEVSDQVARWDARRAEAAQALQALERHAGEAQSAAQGLGAQLTELRTAATQREAALRDARAAQQRQRDLGVQLQQRIELLVAEERGIEAQRRLLSERQQRLQSERAALPAADADRLEEVQVEWRKAQADAQAAGSVLQALQAEVDCLEQERKRRRGVASDEGARGATLSAQLDALKSLQQRLQTNEKLQPWLKKHGLDREERLWSRVRVQPGWELALESALRERVQALALGDLDQVRSWTGEPPPARLTLFAWPESASNPVSGRLPQLARFLQPETDARVQALLGEWLAGCFAAETLDQALAMRRELSAGEAVFVADGHCVRRRDVTFYAPDAEGAGVFVRAHEIEALEQRLQAQSIVRDQANTALAKAEQGHADVSARMTQARQDESQARQRAQQLQVDALRCLQQVEQTRMRAARLDADLTELSAALAALVQRREPIAVRLAEAHVQLQPIEASRDAMRVGTQQLEREFAEAQARVREAEQQLAEIRFDLRSTEARRAELERTVQGALEQIDTLRAEQARAQTELQDLANPTAQTDLERAKATKAEREQLLAARRAAADASGVRLRAADEQRLALERDLPSLQQRVVDLRLEEQAARLSVEQYTGQLAGAEVDLGVLAQSIGSEAVELDGLQEEIERLQRSLTALGAVNLAALDELTGARERKTLLAEQSADLLDAMTTLEGAIRQIDHETRALLSDTFSAVNHHFGQLFPALFGGGQARLLMTGEEVLDAGIQVMAQPPGKKNQTIHLLSGGEKALTAIALVFAIFELNPAPFCLLDEVDAPLDDANTERYANLVARMSQQGTQFLFISHNRIAMEKAEQLIGVTMAEEGVSRLVSVDLERALGWAQAGA